MAAYRRPLVLAMSGFFAFIIFAVALALPSGAAAHANVDANAKAASGMDDAMVYRYWDLGASQVRDEYQRELLRLALEKTLPSYGSYEIVRVHRKLTSLRASREVNRGVLINIQAAPNWIDDKHPSAAERDQRIAVPVPLLKGLLGYRRLIIRAEDQEKFSAITEPAQLQRLVAGQGKNWGDVAVYRDNGYAVSAEADYHNLHAMLLAKRFDYIPLSTIEAEEFIQKFAIKPGDTLVAPNIVLYYPFPVLFHVSPHQPRLAQRIKEGLALAQRDGSMDAVFERYFASDLTKLRTASSRLFVLKNDHVPNDLRLDTPLLIH